YTITKITLHCHYSLGNMNHVFFSYITNYIGKAWIRCMITQCTAQPPAYTHIKSFQLPVLLNGDETKIVGKNIHIIMGWNSKCNFKLAGKVSRLINLFLLFCSFYFIFIEPYFIIRPTFWFKIFTGMFSVFIHFFMNW